MAFASRVGLVVLAIVVFGVSATLQDGGTTVANVSRAPAASVVKTIQYSGTGFTSASAQS